MFVKGEWWNSFQVWAQRYAGGLGFLVVKRGNWVVLIGHAREIECMTVAGVEEACREIRA